MEETVPTFKDVLDDAMTSTNLLEATMTLADVVEAILSLVDIVEVILSPINPEEALLYPACMDAIQVLVSLQGPIINYYKTCILCLCHMLSYCFCLGKCLFSPLGGTPPSAVLFCFC
jgi:hypothetical protein